MPEIYLKFLQNNLFKFKNLFENVRFSASKRRYPCLLWGALAYFAEKKNQKSFHDVQDEAPKMPEIYLKFLQNIFLKLKNPFENVRFSASKRRYPCLLWGALAYFAEKKNQKSFHDVQDEAPKMPEIYLKFLQNIFLKLKNPFENVRFSASKRRCLFACWGCGLVSYPLLYWFPPKRFTDK